METFTRVASIDTEALAQRASDDGRIPICISSEEPVERYFGSEILVHSRDAIDLGRLNNRGLPFCLGHDTEAVMGRAEDFSIGADKKLRARVRFSESPEAQQLKRDIDAGIRPDISVGYTYGRGDMDETEKGLVRVKRWRPLEVSSIGVPADETVGVGRGRESAAAGAGPDMGRGTTMSDTTTNAAPATVTVDMSAETRRATEVIKLANEFGYGEHAARWVEEKATVASVMQDIMRAEREKRAGQAKIGNPADVKPESAKEEREYSLVAGIRGLVDGKREGLAFELSDEIAKKMGRDTAGFYVPARMKVPSTRTLHVATNSVGGHLRFTEAGDFIDLLRNRIFVLQAGAQFMPGLQGNIAMPRQITAGTKYWLSELGTVTNADMTYDQVTLSPKTLMCSTAYSRQLLAQAVESVEALVRNDFLRVHAIAIDAGAIQGVGSSGEPTGVLNVSGIGSVTIGTNGGAITWAKVVELEEAIALDNADVATMSHFTTPGIAADTKTIAKFTSNNMPILDIGMDRPLNGYGLYVTNQVPSNLTKGTSTTICHALILGNWADLVIGQWGPGFEVVVDPYALKKTGSIEVTSFQLVDVAVRHAESFAAIKDLTS